MLITGKDEFDLQRNIRVRNVVAKNNLIINTKKTIAMSYLENILNFL
jgi:hypothetical protein